MLARCCLVSDDDSSSYHETATAGASHFPLAGLQKRLRDGKYYSGIKVPALLGPVRIIGLQINYRGFRFNSFLVGRSMIVFALLYKDAQDQDLLQLKCLPGWTRLPAAPLSQACQRICQFSRFPTDGFAHLFSHAVMAGSRSWSHFPLSSRVSTSSTLILPSQIKPGHTASALNVSPSWTEITCAIVLVLEAAVDGCIRMVNNSNINTGI